MSTAEATNVDSRAVSLRNGLINTRVLVGGQGEPLVYIHGAGGLMWVASGVSRRNTRPGTMT